MAYTNKFNFVGNLVIPKNEERFVKKGETSNGNKWIRINFGIEAEKGNVKFINMMGIEMSKYFALNQNGDKISIPAKDRHKEDVLESINPFMLYHARLDEVEEQVFLSSYDYIEYLVEELPHLKGQELRIMGDVTHSFYKGNCNEDFEIRKVFIAPEAKKGLSAKMDIYINKDSVDTSMLKDENKVLVTGYLDEYVREVKGRRFIPVEFVMDFNKYKEDNPKHMALKEYRLGCLTKLPKKGYVHQLWDVKYFSGAPSIDFDESLLTEEQRIQVDLGIAEVEDFAPKDGIVGSKISELRLVSPILTGKFADGYIEYDGTNQEFEDLIYTGAAEEEDGEDLKVAMEKAKPKAKTKVKAKKEDNELPEDLDDIDDDDDLF